MLSILCPFILLKSLHVFIGCLRNGSIQPHWAEPSQVLRDHPKAWGHQSSGLLLAEPPGLVLSAPMSHLDWVGLVINSLQLGEDVIWISLWEIVPGEVNKGTVRYLQWLHSSPASSSSFPWSVFPFCRWYSILFASILLTWCLHSHHFMLSLELPHTHHTWQMVPARLCASRKLNWAFFQLHSDQARPLLLDWSSDSQ